MKWNWIKIWTWNLARWCYVLGYQSFLYVNEHELNEPNIMSKSMQWIHPTLWHRPRRQTAAIISINYFAFVLSSELEQTCFTCMSWCYHLLWWSGHEIKNKNIASHAVFAPTCVGGLTCGNHWPVVYIEPDA